MDNTLNEIKNSYPIAKSLGFQRRLYRTRRNVSVFVDMEVRVCTAHAEVPFSSFLGNFVFKVASATTMGLEGFDDLGLDRGVVVAEVHFKFPAAPFFADVKFIVKVRESACEKVDLSAMNQLW